MKRTPSHNGAPLILHDHNVDGHALTDTVVPPVRLVVAYACMIGRGDELLLQRGALTQ